MKIKFLIAFLLFLTIQGFAQKSTLELIDGAKSYKVLTYVRYHTTYISLESFAKALSLNSYYNSTAQKIELKFKDYNLKFTAENPFIVLTSDFDNKTNVYQFPTSSYLIDGQIFVPLKYCIKPMQIALGKNMIFDNNNHLVLTTQPVETEESGDNNNPGSYNISGIDINEKANGTLVRVKSDKSIPSYTSDFKDGVLTIVFRGVNADVQKIEGQNPGGLIKKINVKNVGGDTELQFTLKKEYTTSEVLNADNSNDILITLHNNVFEKADVNAKNKSKWDFNVIVIDPGHGGIDPGTIGLGGVKEKDVTLGIALKLGKLIEDNIKDVKVVYTRTKDVAVDLDERGKIANEAGGNLFISIHCNSMPKKPSDVEGFEVYLLRPGRTQEAIDIAERENSVIKYEDNPARYKKLTDENFILVSMAQSAYMKYSEEFSDILNKQMSAELNIDSRGVKQAGFYVLVGASMPSVLIETGFLSNRHDVAILKSQRGQEAIAKAIFESVKRFKAQYEKSLNAG